MNIFEIIYVVSSLVMLVIIANITREDVNRYGYSEWSLLDVIGLGFFTFMPVLNTILAVIHVLNGISPSLLGPMYEVFTFVSDKWYGFKDYITGPLFTLGRKED